MQELGNDVMIVDKNPAIIEALSGRFTDSNICDCTNDAIIKALGVDNFDICFVTIGEDFQASLVVTSLLKQFGARMIVSKAKQDIQADLLAQDRADEIVCPEREISEKLAVRYNADNIFDFIPLTADYSIYELPIQAAWIGQTLSGLNVRRKYQINIIAVKHDNEINPNVGPDYRFREGDHIILIGPLQRGLQAGRKNVRQCKTLDREKRSVFRRRRLTKKAKLEYSIGTKGCCQ